jgi:hypothetical protein
VLERLAEEFVSGPGHRCTGLYCACSPASCGLPSSLLTSLSSNGVLNARVMLTGGKGAGKGHESDDPLKEVRAPLAGRRGCASGGCARPGGGGRRSAAACMCLPCTRLATRPAPVPAPARR